MFKRFWMVLRSLLGSFVRGTEDPELLLHQYIDDMRSKLPKLRAMVAEVMTTELQLQTQVARLHEQIADFDRQVVAALKLGPQYEEEAKTLIAAKSMAEESLEDTQTQLATAQQASLQAKTTLEDYQRDMSKKINEAKRLIGQLKLSEVQDELVQNITAFEVGPPADVLERMHEKVNERTARAQARAELALTGVDARLQEIRRASAQIGVDQQLAEYKQRLGLSATTGAVEPSPSQSSGQQPSV